MADAVMDEGLVELPLFDPAYKADPYPWYRQWTAMPPFWARVGGQRVVVAARHADVAAVYLDHERFSSVKPPSPDLARFDFFNGMRDMVHTDPPDHTRLRRIVNPAFTPGGVQRLQGAIQAEIDRLLDGIDLQASGFDVMEALARPLSREVMLGVLLELPAEDHAVFERLSAAMGTLGEETADGGKPAAYVEAWAAGEAYCRRVIAEQMNAPADTLVGRVVRGHLDGELAEGEVLVMLIGLFVGGLSTIASLIGNAFVQLLSRPEQHALLRARPELAGSATDEVLRFDSPGLFNYKFATRDLEFAGLEIPAGTTVYILQQATGFDPAAFAEPERFDILRGARNHLSFGYGVHFCLGSHLARLVTRLVLETVMRRLPPLELDGAGPVEYGGWEQERAPLAVPVRIVRIA